MCSLLNHILNISVSLFSRQRSLIALPERIADALLHSGIIGTNISIQLKIAVELLRWTMEYASNEPINLKSPLGKCWIVSVTNEKCNRINGKNGTKPLKFTIEIGPEKMLDGLRTDKRKWYRVPVGTNFNAQAHIM